MFKNNVFYPNGVLMKSFRKEPLKNEFKFAEQACLLSCQFVSPYFSCNMVNNIWFFHSLDDAEGDAHQFLPAAALLLTSGRSDDPN